MPSPTTASMPPASKKFLAKVARAVNSAGVPRLARKIFGRAPVLASISSDASRNSSNGSARRMPRQRRRRSRPQARRSEPATGATSSTAARASCKIGIGMVPVRTSLPRATAFCRSARTAATLFWIGPDCSAAQAPPAFRSPGTSTRPRRKAAASKPRSRRSRRPGRRPAPGWILPEAQVAYCARCAARNASGRPSGAVCGSTVIASAPPKPAGSDRDGGAQHVHVRIAPRHHPPRGLGRDHDRFWRKPAGRLDPRPQFSRGAEFGDGEELIGVRREPEIDRVARRFERHAADASSARR